MTWTSEQKQRLERENARIGFRPDGLVPTPADPELLAPERYLALLRTVPDRAGVGGFFEALKQRSREHAHPLY
jgi:hypothetical protein